MIFWWCCVGVIALFLFFFIFGLCCFFHANRRRKHYPADRHEHGGGEGIPDDGLTLLRQSRAWFDAAPFESVSVTSHDGLRLVGQLLRSSGEAKGVVLCFHGYHSSCRRDLSIQAMQLHTAGYHLILASQRSHGESEGTYICFGAKEHLDVKSWCCLACQRFPDLPIALMGLSMGAATVLMSANTSLPPQVRGIIADCGFTSPWEIIWRTLRRKHKIPPFPVIYFMNHWSRLLAKFDYREISSLSIIPKTELPILLIHGEEDLYVPCEMSRRVAQARLENTELLLVPHAKHAQAIFYAPEAYENTVLSFLSKHL